jgi:thiol-disulfide isomerase/thioredoxin
MGASLRRRRALLIGAGVCCAVFSFVSLGGFLLGFPGDQAPADRLAASIEKIHLGEGLTLSGQEPMDAAERTAYLAKLRRRREMVKLLCSVAPNDKRLPGFMVEDWTYTASAVTLKDAYSDAQKVLRESPGPGVEEAARFYVARTAIDFPRFAGRSWKQDPLAVAKEMFLDRYPRSEFAPELLWEVSQHARSVAGRLAPLKQILRDFPDRDGNYAIRDMVANRDYQRTAPRLGSSISLDFRDAISGKRIETKGKVVLLDGWASYCASCVARFPELRDLYATYRHNGLEIVGIAMNDKRAGGLDMVRYYLSKHPCPWPQFYEGGYGAFCSRWSIVGGTLFVLDRQGRVVAKDPGPNELARLAKRLTSA